MSPATFAHLLHSLQAFAGGRVLALLEGGYFLPSLAGDFQANHADHDIDHLPPRECKSVTVLSDNYVPPIPNHQPHATIITTITQTTMIITTSNTTITKNQS